MAAKHHTTTAEIYDTNIMDLEKVISIQYFSHLSRNPLTFESEESYSN